jgi:hypothetical protein
MNVGWYRARQALLMATAKAADDESLVVMDQLRNITDGKSIEIFGDSTLDNT